MIPTARVAGAHVKTTAQDLANLHAKVAAVLVQAHAPQPVKEAVKIPVKVVVKTATDKLKL